MSRFYKCTLPGGQSVHRYSDPQGLKNWPLPHQKADGSWEAGDWKGPDAGTLRPHFKGLHLAYESHVIFWLREEIYLAEAGEERVFSDYDCMVARQARLLCQLELPPKVWVVLALEQARLAHELFVALGYEWDLCRALEYGLENASFTWEGPAAKYLLKPQALADRWGLVAGVVALCKANALSGMETNLNSQAGLRMAECIAGLQGLSIEAGQRNWEIVKHQANGLVHAAGLLVENLQFRKGMVFKEEAMPEFIQPYLTEGEGLLGHRVRHTMAKKLNDRLLGLLREHNPRAF